MKTATVGDYWSEASRTILVSFLNLRGCLFWPTGCTPFAFMTRDFLKIIKCMDDTILMKACVSFCFPFSLEGQLWSTCACMYTLYICSFTAPLGTECHLSACLHCLWIVVYTRPNCFTPRTGWNLQNVCLGLQSLKLLQLLLIPEH